MSFCCKCTSCSFLDVEGAKMSVFGGREAFSVAMGGVMD